MTHDQCFVFMKTLKKTRKKTIIWFGDNQCLLSLCTPNENKITINISTLLAGCLRASGTYSRL